MTNMFMILDTQTADTICSAIPVEITNISSMLYTIIKIGVPLLLIFYGMWDFGKAVFAGKEDEIKSNQKLFIKRLVSAVIVFLVLAIVQLVLGLVTTEDEDIMSCIKTILGAQ